MSDTPLTLRRDRLVVGEMLTFPALLAAETTPSAQGPSRRKVRTMLNTVVRQIAFVEFEPPRHDDGFPAS